MITRIVFGLLMLVVTVAAGVAAISGLAAGASTLVGLAAASSESGAGANLNRRRSAQPAGAPAAVFELARPASQPLFSDSRGLEAGPAVISASVLRSKADYMPSRGSLVDELALQAVLFDGDALEALEAGEPALAGCASGPAVHATDSSRRR
jgi:hypothetical protein